MKQRLLKRWGAALLALLLCLTQTAALEPAPSDGPDDAALLEADSTPVLTGIRFAESAHRGDPGETLMLDIVPVPEDFEFVREDVVELISVSLVSSNESAVTVLDPYDCEIQLLAPGTAALTLTAETIYGTFTDTCTVTVAGEPDPLPTQLELSWTETVLTVGSSTGVAAILTPAGSSAGGVLWSCSDPSIAAVTPRDTDSASASIRALREGTVTIRATSEAVPGLWAECTLTVLPGEELPRYWRDSCADSFSALDDEAKTLTLYTPAELVLFAQICESSPDTFKDYTIRLGGWLDLTGRIWEPIHSTSYTSMTFDGNGNRITGLTVRDDSRGLSSGGLFAEAYGVTIENLEVYGDVQISNLGAAYYESNRAGGIAAACRAIRNCTFSGTLRVEGTRGSVGGVTGECSTTVESCTARGTLEASGWMQVGGVAAFADQCLECRNYMDITLDNDTDYYGHSLGGVLNSGDAVICTNYGTLTSSNAFIGGVLRSGNADRCYNLGSILGREESLVGGVVCFGGSVLSCDNLAPSTVSEGGWVGGVAYSLSGSMWDCKSEGLLSANIVGGVVQENAGFLESCRADARLQGSIIGVIAYRNTASGTIQSCENRMDLIFPAGNEDPVSVAGIAHGNSGRIINCVNSGTLIAGGAYGIAAECGPETGSIEGCTNYGQISSLAYNHRAAGIVGDVFEGGRVEYCVNYGTIYSARGAGGIAAECDGGTLRFCQNAGPVTGTTAGGIVGSAMSWSGNVLLDQCENTGRITGRHHGGGIAGSLAPDSDGTLRLTNCRNSAAVRSDGSSNTASIGGLVGYTNNDLGSLELSNVLNTGRISSALGHSGAMFGHYWGEDGLPLSGSGHYYLSQPKPPVGDCYDPVWNTGFTALSAKQLGAQSSFPTFDFETVWRMDPSGLPVLQLPELEVYQGTGSGYYVDLGEKVFRFRDATGSQPDLTHVTVTAENTTVRSSGFPHVSIPVSGTAESVTISRDGYHTYEMPRNTIGFSNLVTLTPDSVKTPFVELLMAVQNYPYNLRGEDLYVLGATLNQKSGTEPYEPHPLYVSVNWNGHGQGDVWLEQQEVRLPLSERTYQYVPLGMEFMPDQPVYICGTAEDGTAFRHVTTIRIQEPQEKLNIHLGQNQSVEITDAMADQHEDLQSLRLMKMEFDFEDALRGLPIKYEFSEDGTFRGIFGLPLNSGPIGTLFNKLFDSLNVKDFDAINDLIEQVHAKRPPFDFGITVDNSVVGYCFGHMENGTPVLDETQFALVLNGKASADQQFMLGGWFPVYVRITLEAELERCLQARGYDPETGTLAPAPKPLEAKLELHALPAFGMEDILFAGPETTGGIYVETLLPVSPDPFELYLQGHISLVGNLLGMEAKLKVLETDKFVVLRDGALVLRTEEADAALFGRDSILSLEEPSQEPSVFLANTDPEVFQANVFGVSQPQIALMPDGTAILVWTDKDGRIAENGGALYYSVRADGFWSDPCLLDPDGTSDYNPVLTPVGQDLWLTWQDLDTVFDAGALEEDYTRVTGAVGLSVSRFDPETRTFETPAAFGTAGVMDLGPELAQAAEGLTLTWHCRAADAIGDDSQDVFRSSVLTETGWTIPTEIPEPGWYGTSDLPEDCPDLSGENAFSPVYTATQTQRAVLYTVTTEQDSGIYGRFDCGSGWGEPLLLQALPADTVPAALDAVFFDDCTLLAALTARGRSHSPLEGQADLRLYELMLPQDLAVTDVSYEEETLLAGQSLAVTVTLENRSLLRTGPVALRVTDENGLPLTEATVSPLTASGGSADISLEVPLPESLSFSQLRVTANPKDWSDADPENNTKTCTLRVVDPSLEDFHIRMGADSAAASAWVVNRGLALAEAVTVTLLSGDRETELASTTLETLAPGEGRLITWEAVPARDGDLVWCTIAPSEQENISANNTIYGRVLPSVVSGALSASITGVSASGGGLTVSFAADNTTASPAEVRFLAAAYENGQMLCSAVSQAVSLSSSHAGSLQLDGAPASAEVRLFLLDHNSAPLCRSDTHRPATP